jgi:hypothetical protein
MYHASSHHGIAFSESARNGGPAGARRRRCEPAEAGAVGGEVKRRLSLFVAKSVNGALIVRGK